MDKENEIEIRKDPRSATSDLTLVARRRNELVTAKHHLSLQAQRLFLYVLSQVKGEDDEDTEYEFSVNALATAIGIDRSGLYKSMVGTIDELSRVMIDVLVIGADGKPVPDRYVRVGLVKNRQQVRLAGDGERRLVGSISVSLYKELLPYVRAVRARFTDVELKYAFLLPSNYSLRLYELLKMNSFTGRPWRVGREELRGLLGLEKNEYQLWGDFRRSILEKAQQDISIHTDLAFDIEYVKVGREVSEVVFHLRKEGGHEVEVLPGTPKHTMLKMMLDLGLPAKEGEHMLGDWWDVDPDRIRWHVSEAKRRKATGEVKNLVGWLRAGVKKDFRPQQPLFKDLLVKARDVRAAAKLEREEREDGPVQAALGQVYAKLTVDGL